MYKFILTNVDRFGEFSNMFHLLGVHINNITMIKKAKCQEEYISTTEAIFYEKAKMIMIIARQPICNTKYAPIWKTGMK